MTSHYSRPPFNPQYKTMIGTVCTIFNRYKAILEFSEKGTKQRALLKVEKLYDNPDINPGGLEQPIQYFVSVGSIVKCICHAFDETGEHKCGWYVAEVLSVGVNMVDPKLLHGLCPTMMNRVGSVSHIEKRQCYITFTDEYDLQYDVLLLASKMHISGKRVPAKQALSNILSIGDKVYFDAVPVDTEENDNKFSWFATLAWKHLKPSADYDSPCDEKDRCLSAIKTATKSPKSQFIRGKGQILRILNPEYGIALGIVNEKCNHWQSILFHRSNVSIFKFYLKDQKLSDVLKKGDRIRFIAAAAPPGFCTQWVASYIGIDVVGSARDLVHSVYANTESTASKSQNENKKGKRKK